MTNNTEIIKRLAREADLWHANPQQHVKSIAKFAVLIAEECAKECEAQDTFNYDDPAFSYAAAIRAKFPAP